MGYYLLDHPNPHGPHYNRTRRVPLRVILMHITAGGEDFVGADNSAENVVRYAATTTRQVSWHASVDSDSIIELLPPDYAAWHVRNYYDWCYGIEISKRTTNWRGLPEPWRTNTLRNAATIAGKIARRYDIPFRHITGSEAINGRKGFTSHWRLDPSRRDDPGRYQGVDTFPWREFLTMAAGGGGGQQGGDEMRKGDSGQEVGILQRRLTRLGFDTKADDVYGPKTAEQVGKAQKHLGFQATPDVAHGMFQAALYLATEGVGEQVLRDTRDAVADHETRIVALEQAPRDPEVVQHEFTVTTGLPLPVAIVEQPAEPDGLSDSNGVTAATLPVDGDLDPLPEDG